MKKVFILIGAPGSGKGTLAKTLLAEISIAHISSGDILREEIKKNTPLSLKIKQVLDAGKLIDDNLITQMINDRISASDCDNGFILDGYPRTLNQAKLLADIFAKNNIKAVYVFNLKIDEDILLKRITGRYACAICGTIYNKYTCLPKVIGICDKCSGTNFVTRPDDNKITFIKRLDTFNTQVKDIIDFYDDLGILYEFDASFDNAILKEQLIKIIN